MADISSAFLCGRSNLTNVDQLNDVLTTVGRHVTQVANLIPAASAIETEEEEVTDPHHHHEDPEKGTAPPFDLPPPVRPAVPIDQSVTNDYIICLEDGRKFRTMRRHLKTAYGLTPEAYRLRWNLPADYPVISPNYRKSRSDIARKTMFGAKKKGA
ncbi:putative MucR family transcriptional regulatory protein [Acetobacter malorum]|nr:putative MucR family transcriptional regulatory protein RA0938 [Drosophila suzukii]KFL87374.1 putative MucR family transcriptional regulatory protein [Acetobacter malorum]